MNQKLNWREAFRNISQGFTAEIISWPPRRKCNSNFFLDYSVRGKKRELVGKCMSHCLKEPENGVMLRTDPPASHVEVYSRKIDYMQNTLVNVPKVIL